MDNDEADSRESSPERESDSQALLLQRFDKILQKALKTTSKQITDHLTKEIRELGQRTSDLEQRMDEVDLSLVSHDKELNALKEDNLSLTAKLEDMENRSRRSNLRFRGIPEHVLSPPYCKNCSLLFHLTDWKWIESIEPLLAKTLMAPQETLWLNSIIS